MNLLNSLKDNNQDFEWYPTTQKMIDAVVADIAKVRAVNFYDKNNAILEIGAGDGRVVEAIATKFDMAKFAIEKSQILINKLIDKGIAIVGTDFHTCSIVGDYKVVFCNPPYSEYDIWFEKIVIEADSYVYMIVPQRWKENKRIEEALKTRGSPEHTVIYSGDFLSADRQARAKIDIVRINLRTKVKKSKDVIFDKFIFPVKKEKKEKVSDSKNIVQGDTIEALVTIYEKELNKLVSNFNTLAQLDSELLESVGVNVESAKESFYHNIANLKHKYWREIFDKLDRVKKYLTYKSIENIFNGLKYSKELDFTIGNIHLIATILIKQANKYKDSQLIDVYENMFSDKNIKTFKSTKNVYTKMYKWEAVQNSTHYYLSNKIVLDGYYAEVCRWFNKFKVLDSGIRVINDIITVFSTLGYNISNNLIQKELEAGKEYLLYLDKDYSKEQLKKGTSTNIGIIKDVHYLEDEKIYQYLINGDWYHGDGVRPEKDVAIRVKFYKKGTMHINFNKKLIDALNVEFARLKGWIHSPKEAEKEMGIKDAGKYYNQIKIFNDPKKLLELK